MKPSLSLAAITALAIPFAPQPTRVPLLLLATWVFAQVAILAHTWKHPLRGPAINAAVAAITVLTLVGSYAASAQALELGISDAQAPIEQRNQWAADINARWERLIVAVGQPGIAARIRESHAAGRNVILTVGGNGTPSRKPDFAAALSYIQTLPQAERYTIGNEPDMDGVRACDYRRDWISARRTLGSRLLWGDLSPHQPISFTLAALRCGPLPRHLDMAVHPYQPNDPLAPPAWAPWREGGIGNLKHAASILRHAGVTVTWWLTEFGYNPNWGFKISSDQIAEMWPRAIRRAIQVHAKVLIVYTAKSSAPRGWDTRPDDQAWAAIRSAA